MEEIIKKAIEGNWIKSPYKFELKEIIRNETAVIRFYMEGGNYKKSFPSDSFYSFYQIVCDPIFWQALFREYKPGLTFHIHQRTMPQWVQVALRFHEINLTEGWEKAVEYLKSVALKDTK